MSQAETILANIVQVAKPLHRFQERLVAIKFHPDAVSILQLNTASKHHGLERIVTWSLGSDIGRQSLKENYGFLVNQVIEAAREARISGVDAGVSVPAHLFTTRILNLPYMTQEEITAESEFPEFWQEFDPDLTDIDGHVIRFQILHASQNEDVTTVLFCSLPIADMERYKNLLLEANLLPVYLENEAFSLLNGILGRLTTDEIYRPIMVLHMCPNANMLISYARGLIHVHPLKVSDFDEALLLELEELEDVGGDFWDEVAIRLGEHIKQGISFMVETYNCPPPDKLIFVYEHKALANILALLLNRLGTVLLEPWDALADTEIAPVQSRYIDYFNNASVFTSALGLARQGLHLAGERRTRVSARLINMNFLEFADNIRRNRQLKILNRLLSVLTVAFLIVSGTVLGVTSVPTYLQTLKSGALYDNMEALASREAARKASAEKRVGELRVQNNFLAEAVRPQGYIKFYDRLPALVPRAAELQSLKIDAERQMQMVGLALDDTVVTEIRRNLISNKFVKNTAEEIIRDGAYIRFTITAILTDEK